MTEGVVPVGEHDRRQAETSLNRRENTASSLSRVVCTFGGNPVNDRYRCGLANSAI